MRGHDPEQVVTGAEPTWQGSVASWAGTPVGAMVCAGTKGPRGAGGPWKELWAWRSASAWLGAPRPVPWGGGRAFPPWPSPCSPLVYPTGSPRLPTRSENLQFC